MVKLTEAWAVWRVFQMDRKNRGDAGDLCMHLMGKLCRKTPVFVLADSFDSLVSGFLEELFHKMMLGTSA